MTTKVFYSYDQLTNDLHSLVRKMALENYQPDYVVGIARGGVIPALFISHYLERPFEVLHLSFLDSEKVVDASSISEKLGKLHHLHRWGKKLLIVDDICDSGQTLKVINDELGNSANLNKFLTIHYNADQDQFKPDFFEQVLHKKTDPVWITYFFEEWYRHS